MNHIAKLTGALFALTALGSFDSWGGAPVQGTLLKPFLPNVDLNGNPATSPDTPMGSFFCIALNEPIRPILTPSGQPVTLAEYMQATGSASAKCDDSGTHVVIHLSGLIPHGVYTVWLLPIENGAPSGEGPLGAN